MKRKHLERAARQATVLAAEQTARLPPCCPAAPEDLFAAVWPLAVWLGRLERRARKDRKGAKAYRKAMRRARREVEALITSQDSSAAGVSALLRSVPFSPDHWRVGLVPGAPVPAPEREAEAA
jgi:hypothetical protein